ncbi:RNA recognition domain-containing protein [Rhizophagus clarus]|jgi:RNA recognition motif-containing protein|uniref:RNA recognition domain-containing protein n=1 Tax=Rhizophagus clarus TaxID=94130 RepID=A0A8H3LMN4_9GLOM|nr:RNA recognition domain-containing protein [Rhizophagus clarus]
MCKKVVVTNIDEHASEKTVKDFFLFCGKIREFELIKEESNDKQLAYVTFERDTAAKTALMLTNAVIGNSQITVKPAEDGSHLDEPDECDIQASKPKAAICAEILAAGYTLQYAIIEKCIEFDNKYGVCNYFFQYLTQIQDNLKNLDKQYKVTETVTTRATDIDKKFSVLDKTKYVIDQAQDKFNNFFETSTGKIICEYLLCTQKQVADVQCLARKIADDKKQERNFLPVSSHQHSEEPVSEQ